MGRTGYVIRAQFKKTLAERLENPHAPASKLRGAANRFNIFAALKDGDFQFYTRALSPGITTRA